MLCYGTGELSDFLQSLLTNLYLCIGFYQTHCHAIISVYSIFMCIHFITVCNIVNHLKAIVWTKINQYPTEYLVLLFSSPGLLNISWNWMELDHG